MVSSFLDLLETEYADDLDDEALEYIDYAVDGADRMRSMIDALLDYSRVHTQAGEPEPVDSEELLADTISDLQMLLTETDTTVEYDDLPVVEADADQVRQLFQNLLKNAIEHSTTETPPHVAVSAHTLDDMVRFEVADDGPGIDPKRQDKVFDIFQSGDREGTGIGLAVCERIVARHGGNIWVESTPGEGATFCFTLPAESLRGPHE
jgi:signal transduction histidine kinase